MTELTRGAVDDACRYFDRWLDFQRERHRTPGVQAAVLLGNALMLSTAHGVADVSTGSQLTTDHRFRVASHSKTFTATAVLQLAERSSLRLDDHVEQWIPRLTESAIGRVTIRELLSHAGGVVRDGSDPRFWSLGRTFPDRSELLAIVQSEGHVLAANEKFKYSNVGYSLLGLVIEAASGGSYHDWVRTQIIDPLGLVSVDPELDPASAGELASGHTAAVAAADGSRIEIEHVDTAAMAPATGFVSTAVDLVRWCAAHFLGDERVISDNSKRIMQHVAWPVGGNGVGDYGLGFDVHDVGGRRMVGHGGGYPGHITRSFFDPSERFAVSVLTNAIDGPAFPLASAMVRLADLAAGATPDPIADPGELARFEGRFASLWGVTDIAALGGRLHLLDPSQPDPVANPTVLEVIDANTLRIVETIGYGAPGETMVFERAADGTIATIRGAGVGGSMPLERFRALIAQRERVTLTDPLV